MHQQIQLQLHYVSIVVTYFERIGWSR